MVGWKGPPKKKTLTLVRTSSKDKDYVFGGYAGMSWDSSPHGHYVTDPSCFCFFCVQRCEPLGTTTPEEAMWCGALQPMVLLGRFKRVAQSKVGGIRKGFWIVCGLAGNFHAVLGPYGDPMIGSWLFYLFNLCGSF